MTEDVKIIKVVAPAGVSTSDDLDYDLDGLGIDANAREGMQVILLDRLAAAGTPKTMDDTWTYTKSTGVIHIDEGATGFVAGDQWFFALVWGAHACVATAS